jgi:hypothetical protein
VTKWRQDDGGLRAVEKGGKALDVYYFLGVIDILMTYSVRKKAEHTYKALRFPEVEKKNFFFFYYFFFFSVFCFFLSTPRLCSKIFRVCGSES